MLWAVTSYFNPLRYRRRLAAYREFRRRLQVPLLTVELGFDGVFELDASDADVLHRVSDGDVMWQKERLLNVAVSRLPAECSVVASMDCDVFFGSPGWQEEALSLCPRLPMVQAYTRLRHLRESWKPQDEPASGVMLEQPGIGHVEDRVERIENALSRRGGSASLGFGWIFSRELLTRHGAYDACITGGGDTAMVCAALGTPEIVVRLHAMNPNQERWYRRWAGGFHDAVRGRLGALSGDVYHVWHGDLENRLPRQRHLDMAPFGFDPATDISLSPQGAWRWSSDKPALHAHLRGYFAARREDG